jgi:hypothetical protein
MHPAYTPDGAKGEPVRSRPEPFEPVDPIAFECYIGLIYKIRINSGGCE